MNNDEIFSLSLDIGRNIIKCGGEVHRAEDTIKRINNAYNQDCTVFAIPSLIIAQSGKLIGIRKIEYEQTDLAELDRLNNLSRRLCFEYYEEIKATQTKLYSPFFTAAATFSATCSFCMFFGGGIIDGLFSGIIGLIISYMGYKKTELPVFCSNLIDAFSGAVIAHLVHIIGINVNPDKIIAGTIMLLVPGLTVVNAMRDMMSGDMVAGLIELFNSVISALGIAFGTAGALLLFNLL